ncbi:hypothetical protein LTR08_001914 [Meristemomyces frigidus]|nr:hypothetical protein LTR08_001914 [Meristemomyces frigidus]
MSKKPSAKYILALTPSQMAEAVAQKEPCCDAAHQGEIFVARYGCTSAKYLSVYPDGSYAYLHGAERVSGVTPGQLMRSATRASLGFLRMRQEEGKKAANAMVPSREIQLGAKLVVGGAVKPPSASGIATVTPILKSTPLAVTKEECRRISSVITKLEQKTVGSNTSGAKPPHVDGQCEDWEIVDGASVNDDEWAVVDGGAGQDDEYAFLQEL